MNSVVFKIILTSWKIMNKTINKTINKNAVACGSEANDQHFNIVV